MALTDVKTRIVTLKKKDLFHDIDMLSLSFSRTSGGEEVRRADSLATDTSTTNGTRTFTRLADKRMSDIRQTLSEFLNTATQASLDDSLDTSNYVISFSVTTELDDKVLESLVALMHDYVVKGSLADWYAEIGAGPAASLLPMATESLARIRELMYHRPIPEMI